MELRVADEFVVSVFWISRSLNWSRFGFGFGFCVSREREKERERERVLERMIEMEKKITIGVCVMEKKVKCGSEVLSFCSFFSSSFPV
jgi:hypothetical protein